jgi:phenylacetate-coenzyme A ligase PaaK-like adenylate-forming protein
MENKEYLWRGTWISEADFEDRVVNIDRDAAADLRLRMDPAVLFRACAAYRDTILEGDNQELIDSLVAAGNTAEHARQTIDEIVAFLDPEFLEEKMKRELGSDNPFVLHRNGFRSDAFEAWAPLGLLVHVVPGNAPTVAPLSVVEGLMSGNINVLKNSSRNGNFPQLVLKGIVDADPTGLLAPFVYAFRLSSSRRDILGLLFDAAHGIAAWGGEEAVASVQKMASAGTRIIDWGHRISFSYVSREMKDDIPTLENIAYDICVIEQQACSSPQCLYLETGSREELLSFARAFAEVLDRVSQTFPQRGISMAEMAEITNVTQVARLGAGLGESEVIESPARTWRVLVDYRPGLRPSPLYRTIWVKPLPADSIVATLRPLRTYLQTAGLACPLDRLGAIGRELVQAGVTRIKRPGHHLDGYAGEPHDGVYALQRYCRRICLQLGSLTDGLTSFADLEEQQEPFLPGDSPVIHKEDFISRTVPDEYSELFFKSGGTSGKPKMAVYTYEDYHRQMFAASEALFAAGLDPATDRCMNLFFSGELYGGFISFWTILEGMGATQFPMTAVPEYAHVARTIIENRVDTLLGMPFYFSQLFDACKDELKAYGGIKKIFYGGEHMSPAMQQYYKDGFGVEVVRSAIYGSNDAGPLGYSCQHCEGSVHHVMTRTQYLEIFKLDEDRSVDRGETGRLIFTSRYRKGQDLLRYEIGDLGRWVEGPCACGRTSPRFELLGRFGDIFKMGPLFNYNEFKKILEDRLGYGDDLQLVLDTAAANKQKITVRVNRSAGTTAEAVRDALLEDFAVLRDMVVNDGLIELTVEPVAGHEFEKIATSGKLRKIIDKRKVHA